MGVSDTLVDCGFNKPISKLTRDDVPHLLQSVALHSVILKVKAELDQFISGLDKAGVLTFIQKFPSLFQPMFVASHKQLDAGNIFTGEKVLCLLLGAWYQQNIFC